MVAGTERAASGKQQVVATGAPAFITKTRGAHRLDAPRADGQPNRFTVPVGLITARWLHYTTVVTFSQQRRRTLQQDLMLGASLSSQRTAALNPKNNSMNWITLQRSLKMSFQQPAPWWRHVICGRGIAADENRGFA